MSSSLFNSPVDAAPIKKARIEIIPLIDVIFFLLATFVLFTITLNKIQSVPVDLPQASAAPVSRDLEDTSVVIQLSEGDSAFWNKEPIFLNEVAPRLADYKARIPNPRVLVSGDDRARYGDVIRVLDEVRLAGITTVTIETAYRGSGR
jgi:biopolymer transport protein ExbD